MSFSLTWLKIICCGPQRHRRKESPVANINITFMHSVKKKLLLNLFKSLAIAKLSIHFHSDNGELFLKKNMTAHMFEDCHYVGPNFK